MNRSFKIWHFFLLAIGINGIFGYIVGGFTESGRYVGQTFFYGGLLMFVIYGVKYVYSKHKTNRNLIFKN